MTPSPFHASASSTTTIPAQRCRDPIGSPASLVPGKGVVISPTLNLQSTVDKMYGKSAAAYLPTERSKPNPITTNTRHILEKPRPRHPRKPNHGSNEHHVKDANTTGMKHRDYKSNKIDVISPTNGEGHREATSTMFTQAPTPPAAAAAAAAPTCAHGVPSPRSQAAQIRPNGGFESSSSFGSVTAEKAARVSTAWKGSCCCHCVPLGGGVVHRLAGAPETFEDARDMADGKGKSRPHHRRGRSAGAAIRQGILVPQRSTLNVSSQPHGWEHVGSASSAATTAFSSTFSYGSSSQANPSPFFASNSGGTGRATGGVGVMGAATNKSGECGGEGSGEKGSGGGCGKGGGDAASSSAGGRRSGSWGGSSSLDREFHVILKAGVDVFKHCSTNTSGAWGDVVPRRLKGLWTRRCPLDDNNQGLVTLFLDKERDNLCWCPPGAAELVPDHRYSMNVHGIVEVTPGNGSHRRCMSIRSPDRPHPLLLELDSDELYDVLCKGLVRIVERNHIRTTLVTAEEPTNRRKTTAAL